MDGRISTTLDERKHRLHIEINDDVVSTRVPLLRQTLKSLLYEHEMDNWDALYLDLRNARVVDSMGVNWLFAESVKLKEMEKTLVIRISSPAINRVFEFAGLDKLVVLKYRRRKQTR
jgi:anti-anti-sigma factor